MIDGWNISCKIVLKWMPMDLTDGKSTLVQVMAWRGQATSHYLSQCWPRSLSPYGVIRPQWVNLLYSIFNSSVGWVGNLRFQDWHYPLQLSIVIRMRLLTRQSNFPECLDGLRCSRMKTFSGIYATELLFTYYLTYMNVWNMPCTTRHSHLY